MAAREEVEEDGNAPAAEEGGDGHAVEAPGGDVRGDEDDVERGGQSRAAGYADDARIDERVAEESLHGGAADGKG